MKNLFFGLAVAIIALSASAFTNVKAENSSAPKTYYQTGDGVYTDVPPAGKTCIIVASTACTLTFPNDPGVSTFNASQIPALSAQYGTPSQTNPQRRYN